MTKIEIKTIWGDIIFTHNDNEHTRNYLAIAEFVKQKYQ